MAIPLALIPKDASGNAPMSMMSVQDRIRKSIQDYNALKNKLGAGEITQGDFINQVGAFLPDATLAANRLASGGSGGAKQAQSAGLEDLYKLQREYNVYKSGQELLGRDLSSQEIAEFLPRFGDPFKFDEGRAYLAEVSKQEQNSPENLKKKAPQYSGQVGGFFQDLLKRGATQEEADYFGRLLATGEITPYEVQGFIKATPEFQTQEDTRFRQGLADELAGYDEKAFGRAKDQILSGFAKAGTLNSSALDFAMTDALSKIAENRGGYLAQLSSSQYGGNKEAARQDYLGNLDRFISNQDYSRGRSDQYLDYLTKRSDDLTDYQRERDDYMNFLASQPKKKSGGLGAGIGGLIGAGIGSIYGQPGAGSYIGGGAGGIFDYLNS